MLRRFFLNDKNVERQAVVWNILATTTTSFQSMLLMMVLTRNNDFTASSIIAISYSIANLAMTVGKYGIRNFQVSDVKEKYSYETYARARNVTVLLMALFSVLYLVRGTVFDQYTTEKSACILLVCAFKGIETMEDVRHGRMQQLNRLDIGMRILSVRNIVYIIEFFVVYCLTENVLLTLLVSVMTSAVLSFALNRLPEEIVYFRSSGSGTGTVRDLLLECLPVALITFLLMYIGNAPKYIIDSVVSEEEQTCFNIIFMVIFAVSLMSTFIFNPLLRRLSVLWSERERNKLLKLIAKCILYITGVVLFGMVFANVIGRKLLGWIYGVSLENYKNEVLIMLASGGCIAVLNLMNLLFVLIRQQTFMMVLCSVVSLVLLFFGRACLGLWGMTGLMIAYTLLLGFLNLVLLLYLVRKVRHSA
ncbi:MAG: hypothetical protein LUI13_12490 [Lachnospiraceae bacterium]|nr:hypothetical protein [Lachnospiraceae bacterium]